MISRSLSRADGRVGMADIDAARRADRHSWYGCPARTCWHRLSLPHQDETFRPFFPQPLILSSGPANCGASFLPACCAATVDRVRSPLREEEKSGAEASPTQDPQAGSADVEQSDRQTGRRRTPRIEPDNGVPRICDPSGALTWRQPGSVKAAISAALRAAVSLARDYATPSEL
jgi:hypothetical protein